jgi:hypothetical protein
METAEIFRQGSQSIFRTGFETGTSQVLYEIYSSHDSGEDIMVVWVVTPC